MDAKRKYAIKDKCPHFVWKFARAIYRKSTWLKCRIAMAFSGKNMTLICPCCETKIKGFTEGDYEGRPQFYDLSLFEGVRQDVVCPACGSLPRHRILAKWGETHREVFEKKDVLYFAPERGMTSWMKRNKIKYTTADLFDEGVDLKLDIQDTKLPDNSYDVVICNHVLEHVDDYLKALAEMRRIVRPNGCFICSFPMSPDVEFVDEDPSVKTDEERLKRYGQSDHVRLFGMHADRFMEDAGFDVEVIDGDSYPENILPVTGPSRYDINRLFVCRKRAER